MLLSNEDAIRDLVACDLMRKASVCPPGGIYIAAFATTAGLELPEMVARLEGVIATAQAELRTIDEMREPPMDLDETAGVEVKR